MFGPPKVDALDEEEAALHPLEADPSLDLPGHLPRAHQLVQVLEVRVWEGWLLLSLSLVDVVRHGWIFLPLSYPRSRVPRRTNIRQTEYPRDSLLYIHRLPKTYLLGRS
jgi:hypothetical protein